MAAATTHENRVGPPGNDRLSRALLRASAQFVITSVLLGIFFGVVPYAGHMMFVWPLTGIQLGILLHGPTGRRERWLQIGGAGAGFFLLRLLLHAPFTEALDQGIVQSLELWTLHRVLCERIARFEDLKRSRNVTRLCLTALASATAVAFVLAGAVAPVEQTSWWRAGLSLLMSDSLGILVFTPLVLFILSGQFQRFERRGQYVRAGISTGLFLAATGYLFYQTSYPFLFIIFPPLVWVLFTLGTEGGVFCCVIATVTGCVATANRHGPIWLASGISFQDRVILLQVFLWCTVATALPVGSLLDERRTARRRARQSQAIYQTLVSNSEHMILLTSFVDYSRYVSPAVTRILGWTPAEYEGLGHMGGIHPDFRELATEVTRDLLAGKANHTWRYRALCKDGGTVWVEATVRGYREYENGPITGFVATIQDITKRLQVEADLLTERTALEAKNERLRDLASTDELTGIPNRRTFNQRLALEAMGHGDSGEPLHLLMIDVDWFKKFNDLYGHQSGDACLKSVAAVFSRSIGRGPDLAARVGGEEFAVLLPATNAAGASRIAENILAGVRELCVPHAASPLGLVTVSIGISSWRAYQTTKVAELIEQADRALYASKEAGRNRATTFTVDVRQPMGI